MKEHPILFSTPMVQAIIENRKTKTRRIIKPQPIDIDDYCGENPDLVGISNGKTSIQCNELQKIIHCPYGQVGDILWVRETFVPENIWLNANPMGNFSYKADLYIGANTVKWKPAIHMPKSAARIWLKITNVRVERLQDITLQDIEAEGLPKSFTEPSPIAWYENLWKKINGPDSWYSNPWVWVVSFKVLSTTGRPSTLAHFSSL